MELWELFSTFFLIGLVSFGGGYAMIPLIQEEVVSDQHWLTVQEFADMLAIAGMAPGPVATNSAIYVGFRVDGAVGAISAVLGMILPSLCFILLLGSLFYKFQKHRTVKSAFYGLRAVITGLVIYAAIVFAIGNGMLASLSWYTASLLLIYLGSLGALAYLRWHPIYIIIASGILGAMLYT